MNITWIPRTRLRHGASTLRWGVTLGVAMATLAWSASGTVANAQQMKSLQHGGQSFAVVPASQADGLYSMPSLSEPLSDLDAGLEQVGYHRGGGSRCGSGQCGSGGQGGLNCPTCDPYRYVQIESVVMRREGLDGFTRHRQTTLDADTFRLDEYDFEFAPRITIGSVPDCVSGYEASFTGPLEWDMSSSAENILGLTRLNRTTPGGNIPFIFLDPNFTPIPPGAPVVPGTIDLQYQRYESKYWSAEASRTAMAWEVAKLLFGARYISFEEKYRYLALENDPAGVDPPDTGQIYSRTENNLIGLQVGLDMFSPVCLNTSTYLRARAGGYLNLADATAVVDERNLRLYAMDDDKNQFSVMFELGSGLHYQLGEMLAVHGGAELWYLSGLATAEKQIPSLVGFDAPARGISTRDDLLFIGFNLGATIKY